jgi:hypothetical protein
MLDLSSLLKANAIFVHVPKAAGRSVRKGLFGGRSASHMTMFHYSLAFSREEFRRMFKFAFVRNPWDRCFSAYTFLMAGGASAWDRDYARRLARYENFEEFVLQGLARENTRPIIHFLPACHFIETRPGLIPLDFLGYYERFDKGWDGQRRFRKRQQGDCWPVTGSLVSTDRMVEPDGAPPDADGAGLRGVFQAARKPTSNPTVGDCGETAYMTCWEVTRRRDFSGSCEPAVP